MLRIALKGVLARKTRLLLTSLAVMLGTAFLTGTTVFTDTIKGTFDNRSRHLWPGQFVNATVTLTTVQDATTVPSVAIQTGPQGTFAYVITADQTAEVRPVTVERTRGDESIIATGLQPGETIVIDGQLRLTPGSRVSIKKGPEGGQS